MSKPRQAAILGLLTVLWAVWVIRLNSGGPHLDISALYLAGWLWGDGQTTAIFAAPPDIFGPDTPAIWDQAWARAGGSPAQALTAYVYPPIWAAALAPIAHAISPEGFFHAVFLWHVALVPLSAWLAWRLTHSAALAPLLWALMLIAILGTGAPALLAFMANQPQITVTALILLAFALVARDRQLSAGAVLGLAAAIKVSPVLFALLFLFNRQWRALAAMAGVAGALAVLSLAIAGWPLHAQFLDRVQQVSDLVVQTKVNFSPEMLLYQLSELLSDHAIVDGREIRVYPVAEPAWLGMAASLALLAALAALWASTRRLPDTARLPVQLLAFSLTTALFGPLSWAHYFVLPMLLLPALFFVLPQRTAWGWIVATATLTSFPLFMALHGLNHHFMVTALVPTLAYLALLIRVLVAARKCQPKRFAATQHTAGHE